MPTYVYECKKCEKVFEADQRITADPLVDCDCGAKGALRRLIQPSAVMFKGGGFHINDYAPSSPAAPSEASSEPACSNEPAKSGSSDPAPEAKAEPGDKV